MSSADALSGNAIVQQDALSQRTLQHRMEKSVRELLKNCFVETNAAFKIFQRKILVRRMRAAIGQCESQEQRFDAQDFPELRDDWDAAAFAYKRGRRH